MRSRMTPPRMSFFSNDPMREKLQKVWFPKPGQNSSGPNAGDHFAGSKVNHGPVRHAPGGDGVLSFLICGAGRGGTSLLTGLLDCHSEVVVDFEQHSMACLMGTQINARGPEMFHHRVRSFISGCRAEAARHPGKLYGNKITTEQLAGLNDHNVENPSRQIDVLDAFFNGYLSGIKVVFILRDGRTCVRSKMARTGQPVEVACERWNYSVEVYKFLRDRHESNIRVRYEDLLTAPHETLEEICGFLGVTFQPQMLCGTTNSKIPKEYRRADLDVTKLQLNEVPAGCLEHIANGLQDCGYMTENELSQTMV